MWKCFEGPMAAQHTRGDNDRNTNCGDQVSLLGWDEVQQNPTSKEATQLRKQNETPRSQNPFRFQCTVQSSVPPEEVADAWTPYEPSAHVGDEIEKTKEATGSLPACPPIRVNKSSGSDLPPRQRSRPLLRQNKSFDNSNMGGCRKKQMPSRRASMSLVNESECRVKGDSKRSLKGKSNSCRSLCLVSKRASSRSLYLGMTDEDDGEPEPASDASSSAKANDASPPVLSNQSFGGDAVIPEKRGLRKAPKSLNEKEFLVENQIPPVARKISYLQLEISLACDVVEDDAESGWAFKTATTIAESGPQPLTSAPVHMRAVWCLV
jgi:hypothetical protein